MRGRAGARGERRGRCASSADTDRVRRAWVPLGAGLAPDAERSEPPDQYSGDDGRAIAAAIVMPN